MTEFKSNTKFWLIFLLLIIESLIEAGDATSEVSRPGCILPKAWQGQWFQYEFSASTININEQSIQRGGGNDDLGDCSIIHGNNKYIFVNIGAGCTKCVHFTAHHPNVLQYKESDCKEDVKDVSLPVLCSSLGPKDTKYLFNYKPTTIDCPFQENPYMFEYSKEGSRVCKSPPSTIETCREDSQLVFKYEACPDYNKSEGSHEEITCIAQWNEGADHYLVATVMIRSPGSSQVAKTVPGKYRCFIYSDIIDSESNLRKGEKRKIIGYKVGISSGATCSGLTSTNVAEKELTLYRAPDQANHTFCSYPKWFSSKQWQTIDYTTNFRNATKDSEIYVNSKHYIGYWPQHGKVTCWDSRINGDNEITIVGKVAQECLVVNICLKLTKRSERVTQARVIKEPEDSTQRDFISHCLHGSAFLSHDVREFTLSSTHWDDPTECPFSGSYSLEHFSSPTEKTCKSINPLDAHPYRVEVGCNNPHMMDVFDDCPNPGQEVVRAECLGGWTNDNEKFQMIAFHTLDSTHGPIIYCFRLRDTPEGVRMSGTAGECHSLSPSNLPDIKPVEFTLKYQGSCPTGESSGAPRFQTLSLMIIISSLACIWMQCRMKN